MAAEWYDGTWNDAGRPQSTGVPRVHRFLKLDGRGTTGDDIRPGQTRGAYNGFRPLTPPVVTHGCMVGNGPKLFPRWMKSWRSLSEM